MGRVREAQYRRGSLREEGQGRWIKSSYLGKTGVRLEYSTESGNSGTFQCDTSDGTFWQYKIGERRHYNSSREGWRGPSGRADQHLTGSCSERLSTAFWSLSRLIKSPEADVLGSLASSVKHPGGSLNCDVQVKESLAELSTCSRHFTI